ncbi:MAG TPA: TonB family protein [Blastocatellia bacterium]|nr:TonB family protein [Blastocatellia bacterium]
MRKFLFATIFITALAVTDPVAAQQARKTFGPVISAYLTSLAEESRELEFQIRRREISRGDYERTRQRLQLLRRFVEQRAAKSREDRVPELQILMADELGTLGLGVRPEPAKLHAGAVLDKQWKLLSVADAPEAGGARFFVFERLGWQETGGEFAADEKLMLPSRKLSVPVQEVIETIIVPENEFWLRRSDSLPKSQPPARNAATEKPAPPPASVASLPVKPAVETKVAEAKAAGTKAAETKAVAPKTEEISGPRIITFSLPAFTAEARNNNIEGEVIVSALFRQDGWIREIQVVQGLGYGLDERAVDAIKRTLFEPAIRNGQPADVQAQVAYRFALGKVTVRLLTPAEAKPLAAQSKGSQP